MRSLTRRYGRNRRPLRLISLPGVADVNRNRMLGVIPLSALFILFDFVVHNPSHPETNTNLALLDVAAGYFSRLEYATGGSLPSSLLSDFAHIARQFVRDVQSGKRAATNDAPSVGQYNTKNFDRLPETQQDVGFFPPQMGVSLRSVSS